jgi:hypothetical protein
MSQAVNLKSECIRTGRWPQFIGQIRKVGALILLSGMFLVEAHLIGRNPCVWLSVVCLLPGVFFLSTSEDPMVQGGTTILWNIGQLRLPLSTSSIQVSYSENMHGIDVSDQLRDSYSCEIATKKWWHRVYFFARDTSLINSYVLYRESCFAASVRPMTHLRFQMVVAYELMGLPVPSLANRTNVVPQEVIPVARPAPLRTDAHIPHLIVKCRVCHVCRKRIWYICPKCCGTRLYCGDCFDYYHEAPVALWIHVLITLFWWHTVLQVSSLGDRFCCTKSE